MKNKRVRFCCLQNKPKKCWAHLSTMGVRQDVFNQRKQVNVSIHNRVKTRLFFSTWRKYVSHKKTNNDEIPILPCFSKWPPSRLNRPYILCSPEKCTSIFILAVFRWISFALPKAYCPLDYVASPHSVSSIFREYIIRRVALHRKNIHVHILANKVLDKSNVIVAFKNWRNFKLLCFRNRANGRKIRKNTCLKSFDLQMGNPLTQSCSFLKSLKDVNWSSNIYFSGENCLKMPRSHLMLKSNKLVEEKIILIFEKRRGKYMLRHVLVGWRRKTRELQRLRIPFLAWNLTRRRKLHERLNNQKSIMYWWQKTQGNYFAQWKSHLELKRKIFLFRYEWLMRKHFGCWKYSLHIKRSQKDIYRNLERFFNCNTIL